MTRTVRGEGPGLRKFAGARVVYRPSEPMQRAPLVSVVIPTRNRQELLRQALDSVMAQLNPGIRLQIIVADNACQPAVAGIAREYGAEYLATTAVGPGAVRNAGLRLVRGEYVAFLDDDDAWTPDHLSSHLALLESDESLGATVSRMTLGDTEARPSGRDAIPGHTPQGADLFGFFLSYFPSVCAVVARQSVVATLHGFDERLIHAEDWDWNLRLALQNRVGFVDRTTFVMRWRPAQTDYDCQLRWIRLGYFRRVFFRHLLRAGRRRPPLRQLVDIYRRQTGMFAVWLCACARHDLDAGDRRRSALRLVQAFAASPPHTVAWWIRRARQPD
jgi:glycosyltransferase involved in cell wall biosynthesis